VTKQRAPRRASESESEVDRLNARSLPVLERSTQTLQIAARVPFELGREGCVETPRCLIRKGLHHRSADEIVCELDAARVGSGKATIDEHSGGAVRSFLRPTECAGGLDNGHRPAGNSNER
jgi:hypothetical protein